MYLRLNLRRKQMTLEHNWRKLKHSWSHWGRSRARLPPRFQRHQTSMRSWMKNPTTAHLTNRWKMGSIFNTVSDENFGVEIEAYHRGCVNGKHVKWFKENAKAIYCKFAQIMKANKRRDWQMLDEKIVNWCKTYSCLWQLWDVSISFARKVDLTDENIDFYWDLVSALSCWCWLSYYTTLASNAKA